MREKTAPPKKQQQKPQELGIPNPPNLPCHDDGLGFGRGRFFISGSEASNYIGNITLHEKKHDIDIAP